MIRINNQNKSIAFRITVFVFGLFLLTHASPGQQISLSPFNETGVYKVGGKIGWEITFADESDEPAKELNYTLKKNGLTVYEEGTLDVSSGKAKLETSLGEPGAVFLELRVNRPNAGGRGSRRGFRGFGGFGGFGGGTTQAGALVEPEKLQPSRPRPDDFDKFWETKIKQLKSIPENVKLENGESGKQGVDYYTIRMDNINDTHIYGQLAKPGKEGKFPAVLVLQWAGIYPLEKPWVVDKAEQGWLALNIEPHDLPGDQPGQFYNEAMRTLGTYYTMGNTDREESYFLHMYLSAYRAADYITTSQDWNGETLVVMGDSMGGQQSVVMAGLHPAVTAMMACVPSSCDMAGPRNGRAAGFPDWEKEATNKKNDKILEVGDYFDPVNFAYNIKCPSLIAMGFIDTTCPPTGVWSAINVIKAPKEPVLMIDSGHNDRNNSQGPYKTRSAQWLAALVKGEPAPVREYKY